MSEFGAAASLILEQIQLPPDLSIRPTQGHASAFIVRLHAEHGCQDPVVVLFVRDAGEKLFDCAEYLVLISDERQMVNAIQFEEFCTGNARGKEPTFVNLQALVARAVEAEAE